MWGVVVDRGIIFDVKRYAIHDGPGIRTTVFLKDCPLRCPRCHNPEGLSPQPHIDYMHERCIDCQKGLDVCPQMAQLIRAYFCIGSSHIQFNVVNRELLIKAQRCPEEYRDLIVRVAGYNDYFCTPGRNLHGETISRTEYAAI